MFWLLVVIVGCSQFIFGAAGEVVSLVNHKRENGEIGLVRDVLEKVLLDSRGPIFIWTALGNSRVGKSTFINFFQNQMVKQRRNADSSEPSYFEVCHHLLPCTKGMLATAVSRGGDSGIDVFIDAEGGNLAEKVQPMSVFLTIAACISSGPIVLLDTELNDNTFSLVSRIAGHMLDPNAIELGSSCSFRQGGPRIMIIVNRNDGAVLQEAAPGGLQTIWDMIAAERPHENMVIQKVFTRIEFAALPFEQNKHNLDTEYGQKMLAITNRLLADMRPVTLPHESAQRSECAQQSETCESTEKPRYQGTPATVVAAVEKLFEQANEIVRNNHKGFQSAPRIRDLVQADAQRASAACLQTFSDSIAQWSKPSCHAQCSGDAGGCEVVQQWVQPARSAAEACFAERMAKWRGSSRDSGKGEDPFGPSVLDPALQQLRRDVQGKVDALRGAWQYANSVDPARTHTETRTREVSRRNERVSPRRYGGRCYGLFGGREYADYADIVQFNVETVTTTFLRCDPNRAIQSAPVVLDTFVKEMNRRAANMC